MDRGKDSWFSASGVPGGITDKLLQRCRLPCEKEHGQVKRKGERKGELQAESQRGVQTRGPAPRPPLPGEGSACGACSSSLMFARLVISCSFSQHKKCDCTVPPTRHSSSPAGADSFPVSCLLQHFVFTFCGFPFPAPEAIQCHTTFPDC